MKFIRLKAAILATGLCAVSSWAGYAETPGARNCTWCHGISAQGLTPSPRLAGQRPAYLEKQLRSFGHHVRDNPIARQYMWSVGENLSAQTVTDYATYFSTLPPRAANDGDRALAALGERIYQIGMPDSNIAACVVCHGPNAEGVNEIPRLGGLSYFYVKRRLEEWAQGFDAAVGPPMPSIASKLSPDQIAALASYLSFIENAGDHAQLADFNARRQ
jgi:cytochrome c553